MNREHIRELMANEGFLLSTVVAAQIHSPERALFIGKYARQYFDDIAMFCEFVCRISAATQDLYTFRNLDLALANLTDYDQWTSWLPRATKEQGSLRALLQRLEVDVDASEVPNGIFGELYWIYDGEELNLVGQCSDCWVDVFLGDRVD